MEGLKTLFTWTLFVYSSLTPPSSSLIWALTTSVAGPSSAAQWALLEEPHSPKVPLPQSKRYSKVSLLPGSEGSISDKANPLEPSSIAAEGYLKVAVGVTLVIVVVPVYLVTPPSSSLIW